MPEMQAGAAECAAESALEVGPVNAAIRGTEALLVMEVLMYRVGRDASAGLPVPVD
jgi:hypothetical protein